MFFYALTILIGSTLLFLIEPMIARYILPWFGGGPSVWSACMLFFQVILLAGYGYAHFIGSRLTPRRQALTHLVLLGVSIIFLPITPKEYWKPIVPGNPAYHIILLLLATIGLPFALLASTSPLQQYWFNRACPGRSPYRLYSLSNVGSVLGLLAYPFLLEPFMTLKGQTWLWSGAYLLFIVSSGWCALQLYRQSPADDGTVKAAAEDEAPAAVGIFKPVLWIVLAACGSVMLLATTNQMCQEVAVIPFLWILPLIAYLLSFIICFDNERWYSRFVWGPVLFISIGAVIYLMEAGTDLPVTGQIGIMALTLFAGCMVCHGELVRLKPPARHLTSFYLMISLGGALGGIFVNFTAPFIFSGFWEYHISLLLVVLLFGITVIRGHFRAWWWEWLPMFILAGGLGWLMSSNYDWFKDWFSNRSDNVSSFVKFLNTHAGRAGTPIFWLLIAIILALYFVSVWYLRRRGALRSPWMQRAFQMAWLASLVGLGVYLNQDILDRKRDAFDKSRNFYGVLRVTEAQKDTENEVRALLHGPIEHGNQYMIESKRKTPTTYYAPGSGVYLACEDHPRRKAGVGGGLQIGVVGLGAGTSAALAQAGDKITFYEINPEIIRIAKNDFFYLTDCVAHPEVVLGDARISLEQKLAGNAKTRTAPFDVLSLDAFNGDAIPVHLLTKESFDLYWKLMRPDGILAVDISNRHLDLAPVVRGLAHESGKKMILITREEDTDVGAYASDWALVTSNEAFLKNPDVIDKINSDRDTSETLVWTDQYSNIARVLIALRPKN